MDNEGLLFINDNELMLDDSFSTSGMKRATGDRLITPDIMTSASWKLDPDGFTVDQVEVKKFSGVFSEFLVHQRSNQGLRTVIGLAVRDRVTSDTRDKLLLALYPDQGPIAVRQSRPDEEQQVPVGVYDQTKHVIGFKLDFNLKQL